MSTPLTLTKKITKDQSLLQFTGTGYGNGHDKHGPIGKDGSELYRYLALPWLPQAADIAGAYALVSATLWFKSDQEEHASFGATPRILAKELATVVKTGGGSEGNWTTGAVVVYPGPTEGTTVGDSGTLPTGHNKWSSMDISAYFEDVLPATLLKRNGSPCGGVANNGIALISSDETSGTHTFGIYSLSSDSSVWPYVVLVLSTDAPPAAPTTAPITQDPPGGGTPVAPSTNGDAATVQWSQNDTTAGHTTQAVQHQFYASTVSDATVSGATAVKDTGSIAKSNVVSGSDAVTGLPTRTSLKVRTRTRSSNGAWGAYSSLDDTAALFATAYKPSTDPQSTNPYFQNTTTQSPSLGVSINSKDTADYITGFEPEVYLDQVGGGTLTMWAPGVISIGGSATRALVNYAGLSIPPGSTLRWHYREYGRDGAASDWSSDMSVTFVVVTGPTAMSPTDRNTLLLSTSPALTIADAQPFDRYQANLKRNGNVIYDSGVVALTSATSTVLNVPAGVLAFGDGVDNGLTWQVAIRHTGNAALDPASPDYPIQVDRLPVSSLSVSA